MLLAVVLLSACGGRAYWVRPSHYARARGREDAVIPALDRKNEPTFLRVETIDAVYPPDPQSGLAVAEASSSRRGYLIAGFITAGAGGLFLAAPKEGTGDHTGEVVAGAAILGVGVALVAWGFATEGAEADGPSPGFPATVQEP